MIEILDSLLEKVKELRFRDVAIIALVIFLALPVWLTYIIVNNPEKLGALIEFNSGQKIVGTTRSCILTELKFSYRPSFLVLKVIGNYSNTDNSREYGLYVEQKKPFTNIDASKACMILENAANTIKNLDKAKLKSSTPN
jgi:hypothetical protein